MLIKAKRRSKYMLYAVDLFCGVGGLTYGLQMAGINVIAGGIKQLP